VTVVSRVVVVVLVTGCSDAQEARNAMARTEKNGTMSFFIM
jgi:hypothetical protein